MKFFVIFWNGLAYSMEKLTDRGQWLIIYKQGSAKALSAPAALGSYPNTYAIWIEQLKMILGTCQWIVKRTRSGRDCTILKNNVWLVNNLISSIRLSKLNCSGIYFKQTAQMSNKFGHCPSWTVSVVISFHKYNSLQVGLIHAFISFY